MTLPLSSQSATQPAVSSTFEVEVRGLLAELGDMLIEKNRKYGDSALSPKRLFSKMPADEQIRVRLDDKLSRIANRQDDDDEDPEWDLMGYLCLLRIYNLRKKRATPRP